MSDEKVERVVVTVDDQHLPTIHSVAVALQSAGMQVDNVMPTVGIITGEVSQTKMAALESVPGVAAVELDQEMHAI
ncbi:hypothetical protein [Chroococcidiopsis sp. CCMEE 29]|uniref:hypothetical protein n=1 Tax=Chroococcidiopsis sp. CCMEE 29 TaxID=155894 RepID=UPI002021B44F|nr:hypothetical protein [Chroococcidiopsis sp. CCMEE 29]